MSAVNRVSRLAVNDEGFIFDPVSGDSFQVSATGLLILGALREGKSRETIALAITEKYDVSLEDAQRDVEDFLASLKNLGFI